MFLYSSSSPFSPLVPQEGFPSPPGFPDPPPPFPCPSTLPEDEDDPVSARIPVRSEREKKRKALEFIVGMSGEVSYVLEDLRRGAS